MPVIQRLASDPQNPTIEVTFTLDASGNASFAFSPDALEMRNSGDIDFKLTNDSAAGATFVGFSIKSGSVNPNNGEFSNIRFSGNGKKMTVFDNDDTPANTMPREYDYLVVISCNNNTYTSDPRIINDPPSMTTTR